MIGRRGFSLVEMVIVLVLAGLVSTGAISMFSTQNRLNAAMTALGESQENARSAVQLAAGELRAAAGGSIFVASADVVKIFRPIVVGIACAQQGSFTHVYFPMNGRTLNLRREVDGRRVQQANGSWSAPVRMNASDDFRSSSRTACGLNGTTLGGDGDFAQLRARINIGSRVMLVSELEFSFRPSLVDPDRRALFKGRGELIEIGQGFSDDSRFEYQLAGSTVWQRQVGGSALARIRKVRVLAEVEGEGTSGTAIGNATFSLVREIQLRNAR